MATAEVVPRIIAFFADLVLVWAAASVIEVVVATALQLSTEAEVRVTYALLLNALELVYFVAFWVSRGRATIAMRVLNLQVARAEDGRTLSVGRAILRAIVLGLPLSLLSSLGLLGALPDPDIPWQIVLLISTGLSSTNRGLHDLAAGSAVYEGRGPLRDGLRTRLGGW
jgi:uncharacterized RDD family membrane protein YckC